MSLENGYTALHDAILSSRKVGDELLTDELISARSSFGSLAVHMAAQAGDAKLVRRLLEGRADDCHERTKAGETPLHLAPICGSGDSVCVLLEFGASVSAVTDTFWDTPLHIACNMRNSEAIAILIRAGADIHARNVFGKTPLDIMPSILQYK